MHPDHINHSHTSHAHPHRAFTLRDLPLPARLTLTVFLIAVGLGYVSAMVQLHFKEATPGNPLPSFEDVVAHYSGSEWPPVKEKPAGEAIPAEAKAEVSAQTKVAGVKIKSLIDARCAWCHGDGGEQADHPLSNYDQIAKYLKPVPSKSLLHKLITGSQDISAFKKDISMAAAFFRKSAEWTEVIAMREEVVVRTERETERLAMVAWLEAGANENAYAADAFALPAALAGRTLTKEFQTEAVPANDEVKPALSKKRSAKSRQTSVQSLTQSTHAHLLSFAVLWTCTGLCFAFTSYRLSWRLAVAPTVLLAQVVDISFWWMSRIDGVGPYFALGIFATGGVVGCGLLVQIVGSVFDMWRAHVRALLIVGFAFLFVGAAVGYLAVKPQLEAEKREQQQ